MIRKQTFLGFGLLLLTFILFSCQSQNHHLKNNIPGTYQDFTLLPNGWKLTPAGSKFVTLGDLPLNMLITADENYAIITNNGDSEASLSLIDLNTFRELQRFRLHNAWRGLAFDESSQRLFVSAGNDDAILIFHLEKTHLVKLDSISLPKVKGGVSVSGLAWDSVRKRILAVSKSSNRLYRIDPLKTNSIRSITMPGKCYDIILNHKVDKAYVSIWEKAEIAIVDLDSFKILSTISTGAHPCEMRLTKDDARLFVANANENSVSVVDLTSNRIRETLSTSLGAFKYPGSTPNALCFAENEQVLVVANADNNDLALFDIKNPERSHSLGFIPVGWYPTAVGFLNSHNQLLVVNGKGMKSQANPLGPKPGDPNRNVDDRFIERMFKGSLAQIEYPHKSELAAYSEQVYDNTPYMHSGQRQIESLDGIISNHHSSQRSKTIRHVFYIVRENRTYDQVLGDLPQGNGDSSLCLFPRAITPNVHALVENFTLFDNFYVDAEVSADGHNWSMAAYATDYVEKTWPTHYGDRGGHYEFEGGVPIAAPKSGYIWDNVLNNKRSFRNYGEYTWFDKKHPGFYRASDANLRPYTSTTYPCFDLSVKDVTRFSIWKKEFDRYVAGDSLPDFILMRLPNDHTAGTKKGMPTVGAMVADNDFALGKIVETISHTKYWESSIILVVEDDAQDGSDHVDAHRSVLLAIGPYIKHGFVDHTMYSTSSVLKTIELILGLPAMTQYDFAARPLNAALSNLADLTPYTARKPLVNMNAVNSSKAYGSARCEELNLSVEDAIPDIEFNEIIWKAVKGSNSEMPAPVRSAFVRVRETDLDDD